jgi:hypothetical protein
VAFELAPCARRRALGEAVVDEGVDGDHTVDFVVAVRCVSVSRLSPFT